MILKVRYNRVFAIVLVSVAVILIILRGLLYSRTGKLPVQDLLITGFLLYSGIAYLRGTFFELHEDKIVMYVLGGPMKKTIRIAAVSNLLFSGKDLFLTYEGKRRKIPLGPFMANKEDWMTFRLYIEQQNPGGELHEV
jgi:hypothetical protein